jgi:hypothetical protein
MTTCKEGVRWDRTTGTDEASPRSLLQMVRFCGEKKHTRAIPNPSTTGHKGFGDETVVIDAIVNGREEKAEGLEYEALCPVIDNIE